MEFLDVIEERHKHKNLNALLVELDSYDID